MIEAPFNILAQWFDNDLAKIIFKTDLMKVLNR